MDPQMFKVHHGRLPHADSANGPHRATLQTPLDQILDRIINASDADRYIQMKRGT